jgi:hypothetical protein
MTATPVIYPVTPEQSKSNLLGYGEWKLLQELDLSHAAIGSKDSAQADSSLDPTL